MKSKKFLRALNEADDRFIEEARPRPQPSRRLIYRIGLIAACLCLVVTGLNLFLFLPYDTSPPDVSRYKGSPYYAVINGLNTLNYTPPRYENNYDAITDKIAGAFLAGGAAYAPTDSLPNYNGENSSTGGSYVETTDNQVAGVIEADLIKRSDTHIFYLYRGDLYVYEIKEEDTAKVGQYTPDMGEYASLTDAEIYLSNDCQTVTVVIDYSDKQGRKTALLSLDVSDPANICETNRVAVQGQYLSSRKADGGILLMSEFYAQSIDFDDESTFLPQFDIGNGMQSVPADAILMPQALSSGRYTVFTKFNEGDLSLCGVTAFLSYSREMYVSETHIYATHEYTKKNELHSDSSTVTDISAVSYTGKKMTLDGTVTVAGRVKNQYSMDEYEGMLRVVTSTNSSANGRNASLYCISLSDFTVVGEVIGFAPRETVESVRFDGNYAYVCTAVVVEMTDPVFFFDLTDPQNITYKDTGVIDGYSTSLVNFGNGRLLGIGYGDQRGTLKIEIYEESENGVISVDAFELEAFFAEEYKSYFIDRENQLIGLAIINNEEKTNSIEEDYQYILLHFDGYRLTCLHTTFLIDAFDPADVRGLIIDDHLYVFAADRCFVSRVEIPGK